MSVRSTKISPARQVGPRKLQQRTLDTRERILDAALREFSELGFEGASTRNIAAAAGVQHGLITYHFDGKDGVWRAVLKRIYADWCAIMDVHLEGLDAKDPTATLRLMLEDFIRFSARNPRFHTLMSHASSNRSDRLDWLVSEFVQPHFNTLTGLIRQAQDAGAFVQGDPVKLLYIFIGAAVRVFMLSEETSILMGDTPFSESSVQEHANLCLGLFFREPAAAK